MSKVMCIYHGNCADGFGAAWVVRKYHQIMNNFTGEDVVYHAGIYGKVPPDVTGKVVYIVDFSYKRDVLLEMASKAERIVVIDHHESAQRDLVDLSENIEVYFDMEHSGAILTWRYFMATTPPDLLYHIEDRDLWKFKLPGTKEIQAALFSYPYDFDVWDELMEGDTDVLYKEGVSILRKHFKDIHELLKVAQSEMRIAGFKVPALNCPYFFSSDAGHIMAKGNPFSVCYYYTADSVVFSLRSDENGENVAKIAEMFGGGGHAHAAGFKMSVDRLPRFSSVVFNTTAQNTEKTPQKVDIEH